MICQLGISLDSHMHAPPTFFSHTRRRPASISGKFIELWTVKVKKAKNGELMGVVQAPSRGVNHGSKILAISSPSPKEWTGAFQICGAGACQYTGPPYGERLAARE